MKSVIDCIQWGFTSLRDGLSWLRDGFSTLSAAACGEYDGESDEMKALRHEIMTMDLSPRSDKLNLIKDRDEVHAYNQISPNLVDLIIETTKIEQACRHQASSERMEEFSKANKRSVIANMAGLICAFTIMLGGITASTYLIHAGKDIAGTIFAGVTILAVVRMFLSHSKK